METESSVSSARRLRLLLKGLAAAEPRRMFCSCRAHFARCQHLGECVEIGLADQHRVEREVELDIVEAAAIASSICSHSSAIMCATSSS